MAEIPEKYNDLDFVPPKAAQENAQKALRWRDEHGDEIDAGTRVGWIRANQLAKGKKLSPDIVRRMAQFNRHRSNSEIADKHKGEPWKDNGYMAWCVSGDTRVLTNNGYIPIKKIYESDQEFKALSYNPEEYRFEYKKITNRFRKKSDPSKFLRIDLGRPHRAVAGREHLKITAEHEIMTGGEWLSSKKLEKNDFVDIANNFVDSTTKKIIYGSLLGDGSLDKNGRFVEIHGMNQKEYALELQRLLKKLDCRVSTHISKSGYGGDNEKIQLRSKVNYSLKKLRDSLYTPTKKLEKSFLGQIDSIAMAFWIMGDGSLHECKNNQDNYYYRIHTEGFDNQSISNLSDYFETKNINHYIYQRGNTDGKYFRIPREDAKRLSSEIANYVCEPMSYKLYPEHREKKYFLKDFEPETAFEKNKIKIKNIKRCSEFSDYYLKKHDLNYQYDIKVKDNHNYVADGVIVHNCLWGGDEGVDWAIRKTDQMDRRDNQQNESSTFRTDEMKKLKEKRLRRVIREIVNETLYGKEFGSNYTFYDKSSDEKLGSFSSHNTKLVVFRESKEKVYMKVTNKRTGETSGKIYVENVEELQDFLDVVNIIA